MSEFKAIEIFQERGGWWRVKFTTTLGVLDARPEAPFSQMRQWIQESLIYDPETLNDHWRIGGDSALDFEFEEDAMMCYVRYA